MLRLLHAKDAPLDRHAHHRIPASSIEYIQQHLKYSTMRADRLQWPDSCRQLSGYHREGVMRLALRR